MTSIFLCPGCGREHGDTFTSIQKKLRQPVPGSLAVCDSCYQVLQYTAEQDSEGRAKMTQLTLEEIRAKSPATADMLERTILDHAESSSLPAVKAALVNWVLDRVAENSDPIVLEFHMPFDRTYLPLARVIGAFAKTPDALSLGEAIAKLSPHLPVHIFLWLVSAVRTTEKMSLKLLPPLPVEMAQVAATGKPSLTGRVVVGQA